jgi:hypothetical protein
LRRLNSKVFFSEEKKQKTFIRLSRFYPAILAWFFFHERTPSFSALSQDVTIICGSVRAAITRNTGTSKSLLARQ